MAGHVYLVGFMGAGKSTVARLLCDALDLPCVDLDTLIEERAGKPVREIFESLGEDEFRDLETAALQSTVEWPPTVIACGGGVVLRPQNRAILRDAGTTVYLKVTAGEAMARVGDTATRPLLSGASGALAATSLLQAREVLYASAADITVDTVGRSAEVVCGEIVAALGSRSGE